MFTMPETVIHADQTVEYRGRLEIGRRGTVSTHIPIDDIPKFIDGLLSRGITQYFVPRQSKMNSGKRVWYTFQFRGLKATHPTEEVTREMTKEIIRDLLRYIYLAKYPIIWKQDRWGYEINTFGEIKRKWDLIDPKVPF